LFITQSIVRVYLEVVVGHPYVHIAHRGVELFGVPKNIPPYYVLQEALLYRDLCTEFNKRKYGKDQ